MSQLEWEYIGSVLLERERRPVVVLDTKGRLVRANRAMLFFVEEGAAAHQADFVEQWVSPASRPAFAEAWARASGGQRARATVVLAPSTFPIEPVFEFIPLSSERQVRSVMLVMVDSVAGGPALPIAPPLGTLYEVSVDGESRPERLLRAVSASGALRVDPSQPCYRALYGRDAPCEGCPVPDLASRDTATRARADSTSPFQAHLLTARRVRDDVASVSALPLDEAAYSGLVQTRVDALSRGAALNTRERSVLSLLLMGRSLDDIAAAEGITTRMAKYHQQNLLRKLGADSRTDLFRLLS